MKTLRGDRADELIIDIGSHGRRGPRSHTLSPEQIAWIRRTVSRAPEVMVKITGGSGATSLKGVAAHLRYISRDGQLELETDDGTLSGRSEVEALLSDWDLDLEAVRPKADLAAFTRRPAPKLIHRIVFSMPAGTPSRAVHQAVRAFAREEFGLRHRYALVLHTDEPHPHVHVVVKAVSEQGVRLNIRKATLERWREDFARQLRERGIEANATPRAVRGGNRLSKKDGIYRAATRGESTHLAARIEDIVKDLRQGRFGDDPFHPKLARTRKAVQQAWSAAAHQLENQGERQLAARVREFSAAMRPVATEKGALKRAVLEKLRTQGLSQERTR